MKMSLSAICIKHGLDEQSLSFVDKKLLTEKDYAPYCGKSNCFSRAPFNFSTWQCSNCGWKSEQSNSFVNAYKEQWNKVNHKTIKAKP